MTLLCLGGNTAVAQSQFWVSAYWEYWSATFPDPRVSGAIDWKTITHIIHHQGNPSQTRIVDPAISRVHYWSPGDGTFTSFETNQRALIDSAHAHGRKVLLGLGGTSGTGTNWDWLSANNHMKEFVSGISYYCRLRGYDGVDIDWEYPSKNTVFGVNEVTAAYDLVRTLRDTLNRWPVRGTISWAAQPWTANWNLRPDSMRRWVDQFNAMNYDYNDYGSNVNAHHTALYPSNNPALGGDRATTDCISYQDSLYVTNSPKNGWGSTLHYNKNEIAVGLGFYGHGRHGNALGGAGTSAGFERYGNCTLGMYNTPATKYRYHYDAVAQSPYLAWTDASAPGCGFGGDVHFHTFDDTVSIAVKARWAKDNGFGGIMIFDLPGDDANFNLIKAVGKGLGGGIISPSAGDTIPPVISITSPSGGASVSGALAVTVTATDNIGIGRVEFMLNGTVIGSSSTAPYSYFWTTAGLSGSQVLRTRAYDMAGNSTTSGPVTVSVSNVASTPVNIAFQKNVAASSVQTTFYPQNAVDGNTATRWGSSYADPQWIRVDLGSVEKIDSVMLSWEGAYATSYEIQTSTDSVNWTTAYWTTSGTGGITKLKLKPVDARYVRMFGTQRATSFGYSLWEFGVYPVVQKPRLRGILFFDTNMDMVKGADEPGMAGMTVLLTKLAPNPATYSSVTDLNGMYDFAELDTGRYQIAAQLDTGLVQTTNSAAIFALDSIQIYAENTGVYSPHAYYATTGWNLVSVPVKVADFRKTSLFPAGTSDAFSYAQIYQARTTLENGVGYWMKFSVPGVLAFHGSPFTPLQDTIKLQKGWNIIGSYSDPVDVSGLITVPGGLLASPIWSVENEKAQTLHPGAAYWVKSSDAGILLGFLPSAASRSAGAPPGRDAIGMNSLTFMSGSASARTLYFGVRSSGENEEANGEAGNQLPPYPPDGVFDARFAPFLSEEYGSNVLFVDRHDGSVDLPVRLQSGGGNVGVQWHLDHEDGAYTIITGDGTRIPISGEGQAVIQTGGDEGGGPVRVTLRITQSHASGLPSSFALLQNFPNPFNPATNIPFFVPVSSHVKVDIWTTTGQLVATVVDEEFGPGHYSFSFDGSRYASGVYYYRMRAGLANGGFTEVKKMVLAK